MIKSNTIHIIYREHGAERGAKRCIELLVDEVNVQKQMLNELAAHMDLLATTITNLTDLLQVSLQLNEAVIARVAPGETAISMVSKMRKLRGIEDDADGFVEKD